MVQYAEKSFSFLSSLLFGPDAATLNVILAYNAAFIMYNDI